MLVDALSVFRRNKELGAWRCDRSPPRPCDRSPRSGPLCRGAAAWLTEYLISHPNDARALAHLAHARLLCRQDAAAHAALARAETLAPDSLLVLRNRARLALKSGKIDDAARAEEASLPFGGHPRRIRFEDVLRYKENIDSERRNVLDALAAEARDLKMGY
jgi:hypothetical protein